MAVFRDSNGREWRVAIDAPLIRQVRAECGGFDLASLDGEKFEKLTDDICLLVDVLWSLVRDEAKAASIGVMQFAKSLSGDAIDAAVAALLEASLDFFPPLKRQLLRAVAEKQGRIREISTQRTIQALNDPALEEQFGKKIDEEIAEHMRMAFERIETPAIPSSNATASQAT